MSAKSAALQAITDAVDVIARLDSAGISLTVAEVERAVGDVRETLHTSISELVDTYGIGAYAATKSLRDLAQSLQDLGARVIDSGAPLGEWTPHGSVSAVLIAHRLYGDVTRAEEIVRTNRVGNPNRIQAGKALKVRES